MRKFFNYESYAAWRASSGGASTEPVKLVGEGCFDWEEKFDMKAELATLRAQLEDWKASQHYRYIGADGKPVLARSIEDDRDRLKAENEKLNNLMLHYEAVNRALREWHYQVSRVDGHPTAVMITQTELAQALNALDQAKEALK